MNKSKYLILLGFITVFILSIVLPDYFLPVDILNNLPSFSLESWERPKNSLLADSIFQFEPWRHYAKQRILKEEFPFWNNLNAGGAPFFANPITAVLYPLNFLYYALPLKMALYLIPLLKIYLFSIFCFFYFRVLKCSKKISVIGAFTATFSGFLMLWLLWPQTNVFIFLPLILYITEKIYKGQNNLYRWYILLSLSYFFAILGGHPETLFHIGIIHFFYVLFRFFNKKGKIIPIFLSIISGFFMGSIQLLPFFEYLINSHALQIRNTPSENSFLPLKGFIVNIIPFILGAPQKEFYKPFSNSTNFQELAGGYFSLIVFILFVVGIILYRKDILFRLWLFIILFCWAIAYKVWPFWLVSFLPIFKSGANQRLVGFAAFGLITIFTLTLERLIKNKFKIKFINERTLFLFSIIVIIGFIIINSVLGIRAFALSEKIVKFSVFLTNHFFNIIFSTIVFFFILIKIIKGSISKTWVFLLLIPVFTQTFLLFYDYNPILAKNKYYPETELISIFKKLDKKSILEVGNPSLPEDINLIYGINHARNYDAMEVASYRTAFDKAFPIRNQWGNVDKINLDNLKKFGIKYLISDYNLNFRKEIIQDRKDKILQPMLPDNPIKISFKPNGQRLEEIRILTANFNRINNCLINLFIFDEQQNKEIFKKTLNCQEIRDYMFYTIQLNNVLLDINRKYILLFTSNNSTKADSIALWGDLKDKPYIEILYNDLNASKEKNYKLIWNKQNVYLWEVPDTEYIKTSGEYLILSESPEKTLINISKDKPGFLEIKRTFFPGWIAKIDGEAVDVWNSGPFMSVEVPKGKHIIEFRYQPVSFITGLLISLISFISLVIYFIRNEKKQNWFINFNKRWLIFSQELKNNTKYWQHILIIVLGLVFSTTIFVSIAYLFPIHFSLNQTSAINWYTINKYPRQQDLFYFLSGLTFIIISTTIFWGLYLWIKKRK